MHEFALAEGILDVVERECRDHPGCRVTGVELEIGRLRQVEVETLRFVFEIAAAESVAAGAKLVIDERPIIVDCPACGARSEVEPPWLVCPQCHAGQTALVSGNQLLVRSLELEEPQPDSGGP